MDRVAHTINDVRGLQPQRSFVFVIGMTCFVWMLVSALWSAL